MRRAPRAITGFALGAIALTASVEVAEANAGACPQRRIPCCDFVAPASGIAPARPSLGFQVWPSSLSHSSLAVADLLALSPSQLRFGLGPSWRREPPLSAGMTDEEMDAYVARGFAAAPTTGRFVELLNDIGRRSGAAMHLVVWEPPPLPGEPEVPKNRRLGTASVDIVAAFLVATLKHVGDLGMRLDGVELTNEPDGNWAIRVPPKDYVLLVERVRHHAARRGVALPPVYGPGTSTITALEPYLADEPTARALLAAVDVVSVHAWDDPRRRGPHESLDAILARLTALGTSRQIAITEYAIARPRPEDPSPRAHLKTRAEDSLAESAFFAALTARDLMRFYGRGVGTIIYWEFQDPIWGRASFGLLDEAGGRRPVYGTLGAIASGLRTQNVSQVAATADGAVAMTLGAGGGRLWVANPEPTAATIAPSAPVASPSTDAPPCRGADGESAVVVAPESLLSVGLGRPAWAVGADDKPTRSSP